MQTTQPTPPPPSFQPNIPWTSQAQTMQSVPPPQQMDTEQKFGKIVMGILASIFIFAAILIGYAFLPSILQMVGLFVIGAGVSAAGLYGISKKKYPYFFLSVAGFQIILYIGEERFTAAGQLKVVALADKKGVSHAVFNLFYHVAYSRRGQIEDICGLTNTVVFCYGGDNVP